MLTRAKAKSDKRAVATIEEEVAQVSQRADEAKRKPIRFLAEVEA